MVAGSLEVHDRETGTLLNEGAGNDYTVIPAQAADGKTGFDLKFNYPINSGYIIKYDTKANGRVLMDETVFNTVTDAVYGSKTASRKHRNLVIQKSYDSTDYNTKEAFWSIVINQDNYEMKDVVITDEFVNSGQQFKEGSLVVKDKDGNVLSASADYDFAAPDAKQGFTIDFKQPINGAYTVTYATYFNPDWKDNNDVSRFLNRATITGEEMDGTPVDVTAEATFPTDSYTRNNGVKTGKYDAAAKEITWTIKSNYNKKSLTNAAIVDTLKQGQEYIDGSLKIHEMILTGTANGTSQGDPVDPSKYTLTPPTEANGNELQLTFNTVDDSTPYWIEFKTRLPENVIIDKGAVENEALLREGNTTLASWKGNATIPQGGEFVSKGGEQDDDKINWTIYINRGQSYVENAKIIDEPTSNLILVEDSFRLYKAKVGSGGVSQDVSGLIPLQEGTDYTLDIAPDDSGNFELSFNAPISEAYILKYETLIDAANGESVGNTVHFEGTGIKTDKMISNKEIIVRTSGGSGTGSGIRGNLEITKVDQDDSSQVLEGAVFVLQDAKGKRPAITKTTDVDGKALFTDLLYGDYVLEETEAPEGYIVLDTIINLTLDASIKTDGNVKRIVIVNEKEVEPPVTPPVNPPVTPPVNPPVTPPVNPPVTPPVNPPVTPPVDPPVTQPVDPEPEETVTPSENEEDHDSDANASTDGGNSPSSGAGSQDHDLNANASDGKDKTGAAQGAKGSSSKSDLGVSKLPKTGESSNLLYYAAGLAMIVFGVYLRRKAMKQA
ncbi:Collagen binding domain protein [compost metagenome]